MENDAKQEGEKGGCCSGGAKRCCGCKCVKALVLLLVGGLLGYVLGGHCAYKKACPMTGMMSAPVSTPAK